VSDLLTELQLSNKVIVYKELKLKHYKNILKCLYSEPINPSNLFLNLNFILEQITNLTKEEIINLNCLEYLLLLLEIRTISIGSSIFAIYNTESKPVNIDISLNKTITEVLNCLNNFKPLQFKDKNIELNFVIPVVKDLMYKKFLYVKEDVNQLPLKYLKTINYHSKEMNKYIEQYYFFKPSVKEYSIKLSLETTNFIQLIKILFNENLLSVYDNIFYLCKICNMSAEYLENCTYGEFRIFVKKTEEMLQKQIKQPPVVEQSNESAQFDPVDINSLYGNDTPINITPSEFTP
jgi:hypothetical protein